jgi:hypothetical protein
MSSRPPTQPLPEESRATPERSLLRRLGRRASGLATRDALESVAALERSTARQVEQLGATLERLERRLDELISSQAASDARLQQLQDVARAHYDRLPELRQRLLAVRRSDAYARLWDDPEPLVSVPIATYNKAESVTEIAIASVLAQTYQRFEIVVVGDGCTDDTAERIEALGDERIRFENLPHRSVYPDDWRHRWMVAGSPAMNRAEELSTGAWIAKLDDDDEFTPHHIEVLLEAALSRRLELVYGRLTAVDAVTGEQHVRGSYPPELGTFAFQIALFARLLDFIPYDPACWVLDEPGDWNRGRRMREIGVRSGWIDDIVGTYYMHPKPG